MKRAWKVTRSKVIEVGRAEMMECMKRYSNGEKDIKAENSTFIANVHGKTVVE
jgi:hypothetical protein